MIDTIEFLKEKYNAKAVFPYGSDVYGNKIPEDLDFIIVTDKPYFQESFEFNNIQFEISNYSQEEFMERLKEHEISVLECLFIKPMKCFINSDIQYSFDNFILNKEKLRESCSQKSSNSYVKAKKKLIIEDDFNVSTSLKSLWHSFRILDFAIQIAKDNCINPKSSNLLFDDISKTYLITQNDWDKIHEKYKPLYNKVASDFKSICPKVKLLKP